MFRADFVRGAEYIPPIGFHMQEIAQAHIGLQAMNYTPRLSFSQDGPVAPSKLADRVGNLHPVPRRPKENILPGLHNIQSPTRDGYRQKIAARRESLCPDKCSLAQFAQQGYSID